MSMMRPGAAFLVAAFVLAACTAPMPSQLFMLSPAEPAAAPPGEGALLGVGPVLLPTYLDRPEIVTRAGSHGVRLGESDRWAEPLQPMFAKLLRERLRLATGSREVVPVPSERDAEPRHTVGVEVDRFDADETGKVLLDARWRVQRTSNGRTVASGHELIEVQAAPVPDYAAIVAAMAQAVDDLAQRIAPSVPGSTTARTSAASG